MATLANLRQATRANRCIECGKCSAMCPLAGGDNFSARRIAGLNLHSDITGSDDWTERCLTCASCEVRCPQGVRFAEYVRGLRELLPPEAHQMCPHGEFLQSAARLMANGVSTTRDTSWLGDGLKVADRGEVALFIGCLPLFDLLFEKELSTQTMDIARAAIRLLNRLDIEPVLVPQEKCCGHDLLWCGDRESFTSLAESNAAAFAERGVKHILTTCAECCRTWRHDYAETVPSYRPRVQHICEFLAEHQRIDKLTFRANGELTLTYHDPCRLGRHLGVYDAPRSLLTAVGATNLVEMKHSRQDAPCCGTAGFIHCDISSRRLQSARLNSAAETGAQKLLTACPKCLLHFTCLQTDDRRRERKEPAIQVEDLTVFVAKTLRDDDESLNKVTESQRQDKGESP